MGSYSDGFVKPKPNDKQKGDTKLKYPIAKRVCGVFSIEGRVIYYTTLSYFATP